MHTAAVLWSVKQGCARLQLACLLAVQEFNLIEERELAPLKELIDRMVRR